ncbi:MAG: hypothetical protein N2C14_01840, partial [Planctomycetales bacterium]
FLFTFAFSTPYVPLIPEGGPEADLLYPDGPDSPRNKALIQFRQTMIEFINSYQLVDPDLHQWPLNIET